MKAEIRKRNSFFGFNNLSFPKLSGSAMAIDEYGKDDTVFLFNALLQRRIP
jgi:hypothetical protein